MTFVFNLFFMGKNAGISVPFIRGTRCLCLVALECKRRKIFQDKSFKLCILVLSSEHISLKSVNIISIHTNNSKSKEQKVAEASETGALESHVVLHN